jgi:hypothetical protein
MSSKKKVKNQPITIRLMYNADGTVTSTPPSPVRLHKGDQVKFVSGSGGQVYVKLNPGAYRPSEFTPNSGPVQVIADPSGKPSHAECGFVTKVNGKEVIIGWVPPSVRPHTGPSTGMPSTGIETEP